MCRSRDSLESVAIINFSFQVRTHIAGKFNLTWADRSAKVVYMELRGQEEQYRVLQYTVLQSDK